MEKINLFENIDLSKIIDPETQNMLNETLSIAYENYRLQLPIPEIKSFAQMSYEEQQKYNDESLKYLKEISQNTSNLSTVVDLIIESNNNQEKIIQIISEILNLATAKNKEELDGKFMKVISNLKDSIELGEQVGKIISLAITVFNIVRLTM